MSSGFSDITLFVKRKIGSIEKKKIGFQNGF